MIKIITKIEHKATLKAMTILLKHYQDADFLLKLAKEDFYMAENSNIQYKILNSTKTFYLRTYKHWNPFSKVIGYFVNGDSCYLNTRKMNRPIEDIISTLFHELIGHGLGFSHNGNHATGKNLQSFPYKGPKIFVAYLKSKNIL